MKYVFLFLIVLFTIYSCSPTADADKLIRDYYKMQETMAGGDHTKLESFKVISKTKRGDTTLATAIINGTYIPNQVPGSGPTTKVGDTLYWKFYKQNGEWKTNYNYRPF